ncbi:MAG: formate/nitrite transporter family protein [Gammaproteobacteria bacterium]
MSESGQTDTKEPSRGNSEMDDDHESSTVTERALERKEEDEKYVPVIVKRSDEAFRHPDDTLQNAINEGVEQLERHFLSLSLSSTAAGMVLGFTAMVVAVVTAGMASFDQPFLERLATALVYPLGFVICIMSGTQLFTEHTATAVYPVLDGRESVTALLRLWIVVVVFNLVGAAVGGGLLTLADGVIQAKSGYIIIAEHLLVHSNFNLIISAILAGWLMALGAWLIMATQPTMSQIICVYIVTFIIGLGGLHHSIAGSVEMFTALFISDHFTLYQAARFVGLAVFGNLIGGSVFVAVLNYGHIRQTQAVSDT